MRPPLSLFGGDADQDLGVDVAQLLADQRQPGLGLIHNEADCLGLQPVAQAGLVFDQGGPCDLQLLEITHGLRCRAVGAQVEGHAHLRQHAGIHRVGFGARSL